MIESVPERSPHWSMSSRSPIHLGRMRLMLHEVQLPSGHGLGYEVDESVPFAVAMLLRDGDALVLSSQYRYPIDRWILDLQGGAGEEGEAPEHAVRRECEEELGIVPQSIVELHTFYPDPGRSAWPVHLFFADGFRPGRAKADDPAEQVHLVRMTTAELDERIRAREIVDPSLLIARTMAGLLGHLPPLVRPLGS